MTKALPPRVPGRCQPPRSRFDYRSVLVRPALLSAGLPKVCGSLNPGPLVFQDYSGTQYASRHPSPDYEPGMRGMAAVHPVTRSTRWLVQLSEPCSAL